MQISHLVARNVTRKKRLRNAEIAQIDTAALVHGTTLLGSLVYAPLFYSQADYIHGRTDGRKSIADWNY